MAPETRVEIPGEVLATEALRGGSPAGGAEHVVDGPAEQRDRGCVVDHRRDAAVVVDQRPPRRTAPRSRRRGGGSAPPCRSRRRRRASAPCRRACRSSGMTLTARPASSRPHTTLTPARGSSRRDRTAGSSVTILPSAKVRSSVRCGRLVCPPLPVSRIARLSAAPVIGPSRSPTVPTSRSGRSAGRRCGHVVEGAELHQPRGAAGHDLLGRLEQQPHPPGQQTLARAPRPARGRRRAAPSVWTSWPHAWATPVDLALPRVGGRVVDGQGVEVGTQRDPRRRRRRRGRRSARSHRCASPASPSRRGGG